MIYLLRCTWKWSRIVIGLFFLALAAIAEEDNTVEYKFQYYEDDNGVMVRSNDAGAGMKFGDHFKIHADYLIDGITAASRIDHRAAPATATAALAKTDAVTSATQTSSGGGGVDAVTQATTVENRQQVTGSLSFINDFVKRFRSDKNNDDPTTLTVIGSNSEENDYTSRTLGATLAQDLFQRNTTLSFTLGKSFDQWHPVSWAVPVSTNVAWNYLGNGRRQTSRYSLSLTQGLTTTTIASVNGEYVYDCGYLAKPYNEMLIGNTYYHENYPTQRNSYSVTGLLNQYIPMDIPVINGMAVHEEYRWYTDNWAITGHTATTEVYIRCFDNFIVRPSYRWYWQSAPFFYQDVYTSAPVYLTTDLRFRQGISQTYGLKLSWENVDFVKPTDDDHFPLFFQGIDVAGNYYTRQSPESQAIVNLHYGYWNAAVGYDMYWIQAGIKFSF